jgi:hypothetical protein
MDLLLATPIISPRLPAIKPLVSFMIFPDQRIPQPVPATSPLFDIVKQGRKGCLAGQFEIPFLSRIQVTGIGRDKSKLSVRLVLIGVNAF